MKVTLDLDLLLSEGKISEEEHKKLNTLSAQTTGSLGFSILIAFGIISVISGLMVMIPSASTAIFFGVVMFALGFSIRQSQSEQWDVLGTICISLGALLTGGGILYLAAGNTGSFNVLLVLLVVLIYVAGSVFTKSSFLMVLAVLLSSTLIGAMTGYGYASYSIIIENPITTVLLYALLGTGLYQLSKRVPINYEALTLAGAKAAVFLVNFGFWVGSLWGDEAMMHFSPGVFSLLWAVALIVTAVWAVRVNRRWTLNVVTVFAGIHLYTQWFEFFGGSPVALVLMGLIALGLAVGMRFVNVSMKAQEQLVKAV